MSEYTNQGTVSQVSEKQWYDQRKGRNINLYSFQIEGSNRWFRTGTDEPNFRQGDFITFTNDAKANVKLSDVTVGNAAGAPATSASPAPAPAQAASTGGASQNRDGYWAQKEARDLEKDARYQGVDVPRMSFSAAQDRAVNLVSAALAHDCLSFGNMKKGEKLDYVLECVNNVTNRFFVESMHSHERLLDLEQGADLDAAFAENVGEESEASAGMED
jgi:hypothetical protein